MKVKIKDLTLGQAKQLCDKHLKQIEGIWQCDKCPYGINTPYECKCKLATHYLDEFGEDEVEINE